jgi:thioredoxin-like negative regulator of GroEL
MMEECLEQLLAIIKLNKEWEDKKANKEMLAVFKELGNSSPLVQTYRKHLQRTMY